jgi:hypothetical protein
MSRCSNSIHCHHDPACEDVNCPGRPDRAAARAAKLPQPRKPKAVTVQLEDCGQDFTEWDLDEDGAVVACRPLQELVWCGVKVRNHAGLRRGSALQLTLSDGRETVLNYKAAMVGRLAPAQRRAT